MPDNKRLINILVAEDDADDRQMIKDAFEENGLLNDIAFVNDGEALIEYLFEQKKLNPLEQKMPGLIFLDLNMPKKDGREVLQELKADADLKKIPVVILTTSKAQEDILKSYDLGVNGFISKPVSFADLVKTIKVVGKYWLEIVELPALT